MYSSCFAAHSAASSVGIDWFWPSGSSVTRYVDFFDRARTFVWTFRFPYRVSRAVRIFAASALTSAGLGFSITEAASGSRNSIFATLGAPFDEDEPVDLSGAAISRGLAAGAAMRP